MSSCNHAFCSCLSFCNFRPVAGLGPLGRFERFCSDEGHDGSWQMLEGRHHPRDGVIKGSFSVEVRLPEPLQQLEVTLPSALV